MSPNPQPRPELDLDVDVVDLTAAVCDIRSVSDEETPLADAVEAALRRYPHLRVDRDGDTVVARTGTFTADGTATGRRERVLIAGHLDTVPVADNLPTRRDGSTLWGRGTVDMKGGVAVALRLAAQVSDPGRDVTYVFYDHEEVDAAASGLGRVAGNHPDWLAADFAVLMEPTSAQVEGGCNGTLRAVVTTRGAAAHSARSWMGHNAIHDLAPVLTRLAGYQAREVEVDGLVYREGLNAVSVSGGIAGNVVPDHAQVAVNYRFAPRWSVQEAYAHVVEVFDGFEVELVDSAGGARPGLEDPAAQAFLAAVRAEPHPKLGWTDVARFAALGVPAVNYGPGDPSLAHHDDERVDVAEIVQCEQRLLAWLSDASAPTDTVAG